MFLKGWGRLHVWLLWKFNGDSQFIMYVSLGCHCDNFMQQIYIMPCTYNKFPIPKAHIHPKFKQTPKTSNPIPHMHKHLLRI